MIQDFTNLIAPFVIASAADNITIIMNPIQGMRLALVDGDGHRGRLVGVFRRANLTPLAG